MARTLEPDVGADAALGAELPSHQTDRCSCELAPQLETVAAVRNHIDSRIPTCNNLLSRVAQFETPFGLASGVDSKQREYLFSKVIQLESGDRIGGLGKPALIE